VIVNSQLKDENERLKDQLADLQKKIQGFVLGSAKVPTVTPGAAAGPDSGTGAADPNARRLQAKVKQYETILKKSEAEKTELKSRLTLAEGKAAAMEKLLAEKARAYAKSGQEMRAEL
jgi:cell division septum initiation protein DivIVA